MNTRSLLLSCFILFIALSSCVKKNIPPVINDQTFLIDENSAENLFVGQVLANDEDGQVTSFSIMSGNINDAFSISETDGKITVKNNQALDYETTPVFLLTIEVKDNRNKGSIAKAVISLINVDESPRIVSLLTDQLRYGNVLTIYGKYFNKLAGATFVCLKGNSQIYTLTPLSVTTDSIKVEIYNQQNPTQLFDLNYLQVGIKTDNLTKWSDYYVTLLSSWRKLNNFPGGDRYKGAAFAINGKGYVGLGAKISNQMQNDMWQYTPSMDSWVRVADFPGLARLYPTVFYDSEYGYVGGGQSLDNSSQIPYVDFYKYNPAANNWMQIADAPLVEKSYPGYSVSTSGGQHFANLKTGYLYKYLSSSNSWSEAYLSASGTIYRSAQSFSINDRIFIIGGCNNDVTNGTNNEVWEYNRTTNTMIRKADFPGISRYGGFSFSIGKYGYMGCGVFYIFNGTIQYLTDVFRYNSENDTWVKIDQFPGGYKLTSMSFVIGSKGYVAAGFNQNTLTSDVWEFSTK